MFRQSKEPLMEACQILAEQEHLGVTIRSVAKGALITGIGAFAGGLVGGPMGIALGGTLASVTTAMVTRGTYKSVGEILRNDLTPGQKRKLMSSLRKIVKNVKTDDVVTLVSLIATQSSIKDAVIREIGSFLSKELNLTMITN